MAILTPRNPPKSWLDTRVLFDDEVLDWANPNPSNPLYLACIVEACKERDFSAASDYSGYHYSLQEGVVPWIISKIRTLMQTYLVLMPGRWEARWPHEAPYVPMADYMRLWVPEGNVYRNPYTGFTHLIPSFAAGGADGCLIESNVTKEWLKSCRFILDKCVVREAEQSWYGSSAIVEEDARDQWGSTSWSGHWSTSMTKYQENKEDDIPVGLSWIYDPTAITKGYPAHSYGGFVTNLKYAPGSKYQELPHLLIIYFKDLPTTPAQWLPHENGFTIPQQIHWDCTGYEFTPGRNERFIPAGRTPVVFGGSTPIEPPSPSCSWGEGAYTYDPDMDESSPTNTWYSGRAEYEYVDFTSHFRFKAVEEIP